MNEKEYWQRFVGEKSPLDFMKQFQSRNPARCAERYVSRLPRFYGIVRQQSWRESFEDRERHTPQSVTEALTAHLEHTRSAWEKDLRAYDKEIPEAAPPPINTGEAQSKSETAEACASPAESVEETPQAATAPIETAEETDASSQADTVIQDEASPPA